MERRRTCILLMTFHPSSTPNMGMYLDSLGNSSWSNTSNVPFSYLMACRVMIAAKSSLTSPSHYRSAFVEIRDEDDEAVTRGRSTTSGQQLPLTRCRRRSASVESSTRRGHLSEKCLRVLFSFLICPHNDDDVDALSTSEQ